MTGAAAMLRLLALAMLLVGAGCDVNPFTITDEPVDTTGTQTTTGDGDGDGDGDGSGDGDGDGDSGDGDGDGDEVCVPTPETCDAMDNDCDDMVDENFDLDADPNNCGECGRACEFENAFGLCDTGNCAQGDCFPGYVDLNDDPVDGCEYFCIPTNGGVEICDGLDNNCDGDIDEGFNTDTDVNNCGICGRVCDLLNASAVCEVGKCEVLECDEGFVDIDPDVPGCELFCTPSNNGVEACDGADNDCDGLTDEGNPDGGAACGTNEGVCSEGVTTCSFGILFCVGETTGQPEETTCDGLDEDCDGSTDEAFDRQNDPLNCGASCTVCQFTNASARCTGGSCALGDCNFGFHDINGNPGDGCEYACITTGAESCDNIDNDCDGDSDEGFDTSTDVDNCGSCNNACAFDNAVAVCTASRCELAECLPNFFDLNGDPSDGCEYGCAVNNGGIEACDNGDNDCDGSIDEGDPGGGANCGTDEGICTFGTTQCVGGTVECIGGSDGSAEVCDLTDDEDCDGTVDEGFDTQNDPRFCGDCTPCVLANAVAGCTSGNCVVTACATGYVDADGNPDNGCELFCTPTGTEVCDGLDNDCDGLVDTADPDLSTPANFCRQAGECAGAEPVCAGADGFVCNYADLNSPPTNRSIELDGNDVVLEESVCDGLDNDCDGGDDEVFTLLGTPCAEDGTFGTDRNLGACRGTGSLVCNAQGTDLTCNVTSAGATPTDEDCDGEDNDCDGHVDEPWDFDGFDGVREDLVGPVTIGGDDIVMYRYEASRPDATSSNGGAAENRSCSKDDVRPWSGINFNDASAACEAAGMRLCEVTRDGSGDVVTDEWGRFCGGSSAFEYPYGDTYEADSCNGSDYDPVAGGVNEDQVIATGSLNSCRTNQSGIAFDAYDQSGNLKEWVSDPRTVGGSTFQTLRGGSFDNQREGLTCEFDFTIASATFRFPNVGFRCCALECPDGQTDCGGTCVDLAADESNCGACGTTCGGGGTCQNGYCCPSGTELCADECVPTGTCSL